MYVNKVILYGNLTRDPEIRALPSGVQVANFSIATNRVYKDRDGKKQEQVEYHNIVAFARQAELIGQYLTKGSPIYVDGRLQTRTWDKDGVKQYRTEIVIETFQFGPKSAGQGQNAPNRAPSAARKTPGDVLEEAGVDYPEEEINPDDIPF